MEVKWCRMNAATSNNRRGIWFKEFTDLWMCAQHIAQVKLNLWYLHKQTNQILSWHTDPNCTLRSWHRTLLQTHTKTNTSRALTTTHTSKNIPHAVHVKRLLFFRSIVILRPALESNLSVHESVWKKKRASHGVLRWEQNWSRHQLVKRPSMIGNKPSQDRTIFSHLCCRKPIAPSSFFFRSLPLTPSQPKQSLGSPPPQLLSLLYLSDNCILWQSILRYCQLCRHLSEKGLLFYFSRKGLTYKLTEFT